jgi:hypothetical protein
VAVKPGIKTGRSCWLSAFQKNVAKSTVTSQMEASEKRNEDSLCPHVVFSACFRSNNNFRVVWRRRQNGWLILEMFVIWWPLLKAALSALYLRYVGRPHPISSQENRGHERQTGCVVLYAYQVMEVMLHKQDTLSGS